MRISLLENWDMALDEALKAVKGNRLMLYPTEFTYALGGNALDRETAERIYKILGRMPDSAMVANLEMLLEWFEVNDEEARCITRYCPGPYMFLLKPKKEMPIQNDRGLVGVVIPNHYFMRRVCFESGRPLLCMLNEFSEFSKIPEDMVSRVDLAIDAGVKIDAKSAPVINVRARMVERAGSEEFSFE